MPEQSPRHECCSDRRNPDPPPQPPICVDSIPQPPANYLPESANQPGGNQMCCTNVIPCPSPPVQPVLPPPPAKPVYGGHVTVQVQGKVCGEECAAANSMPPEPIYQCAPPDNIQVPASKDAALPLPPQLPPCYLPQPGDDFPKGGQDKPMGPLGPWATGRVDWGPLAGLTGTRPVVDRYSVTRFSPGEWRQHTADILAATDDERHRANLIDWNGRRCVEQTVARTNHDQLINTRRLEQRAHEIHRWKMELERALIAMNEEINLLQGQRQRLRTALGVLRMPKSIAGECLERRTARLEPDLVRDKTEEELIKEVALINEVEDLMNRMLVQIEEQLKANMAVKQRLEMEWSDRKEALEIESINIGLRNTSPTIMFHPGATRFCEGQSTPETWEFSTRENLAMLETERNKSKDLRHLLQVVLTDATRDLRHQADCVDTALAVHIASTDECRQHLEIQLQQTLQRIVDTEKLIRDLKDAIHNQDFAMKVVQTRLANRLNRPRAENCRDVPQFGLVDEVKSISESVAALSAQLQQAQDSLQGLLKTRANLEYECLVKRKTLSIDRDRLQEIRSHYPSAAAISGH